MIQVTGFSVERFLNLAACEGLRLWNVSTSPHGVSCALKAADLNSARLCAEKTGCVLHLREEHGLPRLRRRYGKRRLLTGGLLFFLAGLYAASSVLWTVEVSGSERLAETEILAACAEEGLVPGKWKGGVDTKALGSALLARFPDLAWVSVSVTGTKALVRVAETIAPVTPADRVRPTDIVAREDGVVLSIATSAGTPLVRAGDVVRQGSVLVSALVEEKDGDTVTGTYKTHARAQITGRVWREFSDSLSLTYWEEVPAGEEEINYSLRFGSRLLDVWRPDTEEARVVLEWEKGLRIGDYELPLALRRQRVQPYTKEQRQRSREEGEETLKGMLEAAVEASLTPQETAEPYEITYTLQGETLTARAAVPVLCPLGEERPLDGAETEERN